MSKKEKNKKLKKIESVSTSDSEEIMRMIKVFGGVVLALVSFYFIFAIYNGEIKFGDDEEEAVPVEIQNVRILAGSTFTRMEEEYYVLMYDFEGDNSIYGSSLYNLYSQKTNGHRMYLVDLGHVFNSKYMVESLDKVNVSSVDTLAVVDVTLLKVKNGKTEFVKSGIDAVKDYQDTLLK